MQKRFFIKYICDTRGSAGPGSSEDGWEVTKAQNLLLHQLLEIISREIGVCIPAQGLSRAWGALEQLPVLLRWGTGPGCARDRPFTPALQQSRFVPPAWRASKHRAFSEGRKSCLKQILAEINVNLLNLPCLLLFPSASPLFLPTAVPQ